MISKAIASIIPFLPKRLVWVFSHRYIAGETLQDAIDASKQLNTEKNKVTIDLLGEFINDLAEAEEYKKAYLEIIDTFEKHNIEGSYSLKPTMFGLLLDSDVCYQNIRGIVQKAAQYNNFIRIDMEDSKCTDKEIELFKKLHNEFPKNTGLVFQAYLKRTFSDLEALSERHANETPVNIRLCKGIYVESPEIAYKKYEEINQNYLKNLEWLFQNDIFVGIATHDKPLIEGAYRLIEKHNVPKNRFEFQMLYGVTPELRKSIIEKGYSMRVYVPFGKDWFGYSTRRLKENPKMVSHIIKAVFVRK